MYAVERTVRNLEDNSSETQVDNVHLSDISQTWRRMMEITTNAVEVAHKRKIKLVVTLDVPKNRAILFYPENNVTQKLLMRKIK